MVDEALGHAFVSANSATDSANSPPGAVWTLDAGSGPVMTGGEWHPQERTRAYLAQGVLVRVIAVSDGVKLMFRARRWR